MAKLSWVSTTYRDPTTGALILGHDVPAGHSLVMLGAGSLSFVALLNEIGGSLEGSSAGGPNQSFSVVSGSVNLNVFCYAWNLIRNVASGETVSFLDGGNSAIVLIELDGFIGRLLTSND